MNILITGASGMLGATISKLFSDEFNIYGTGNSEYNPSEFNYRKFDLKSSSYKELINWSNPSIIVHCAALTNGNNCEDNSEQAFNVNGFSVKKLLESTNDSVKIIYISTDAVFPSSLHLANEVDSVCPENVYGKSKELGEFFLNSSTNRVYTIVRTTIVGLNLNENKSGFVEWIINTTKDNNTLGLFSDVLFTPISIWDLANEIKFLINSNNINSETLHIAGGLCTKYEFGKLLLKSLNLATNKLVESSILNFDNRAKRSTNQSINSSFYKQKYKRKLPNLKQTISTIQKCYYEQDKIRK